ncbi:MAG: arsenic metallochaperone ArsD family protein, partial [Chloroflexi bacterium]|nr:arsenic metallochaperone ArsD family protein [Chloroflexota bacterium]
LQAEGVSVSRYQMTSHPNSFLSNADVMKLVRELQMDALPITVVRGKVIKTKTYPTLAEVKNHLNGAQS